MHSVNHWGGSFDITTDVASEDDDCRNTDVDAGALSARQHHELDETQQGWLLSPEGAKKRSRHVDLGCVVVKRKVLRWAFWGLVAGFVLVGLPVTVYKSIPHRPPRPPPPDRYAEALHKALLFFNAQKCELPRLLSCPASAG
jgi:endoglucanase